MNPIKIKTANGVYEIKRPVGKLGAKSMIVLSKLATAAGPTLKYAEDEDPAIVERIKMMQKEAQMEQFGIVFEEWAEKILPAIIVSGPFKYEDMPGEDQLAIFMAVTQESQLTGELFQVLPPEPSV